MGKFKKTTRQEKEELIKYLTHDTHFNKNEVEWMLALFDQLAGKGGNKKPGVFLERLDFLAFLFKQFGMTDDLMMERVFRSFNSKNDSRLCQDQFVKGMSIWLRGTLLEKMKFAFCVYDFNSDGYITKEEIFNMFKDFFPHQFNKGVMGDEDPEEGIKDLVDIIMKKLDKDNDFRISLNDFETSVPDDTLLLECLGPWLPDREGQSQVFEKMARNEALVL